MGLDMHGRPASRFSLTNVKSFYVSLQTIFPILRNLIRVIRVIRVIGVIRVIRVLVQFSLPALIPAQSKTREKNPGNK